MEWWATRPTAWGQYLVDKESPTQVTELRQFTHSGRPLDTPEFVAALERFTLRPLAPRRAGRPKNQATDSRQPSLTFVA